ncbi:glycosyltransferase family 4 protein [Kineococcus radiotolerans]|uniref:glycosyltransferase family 4 protein n=1 Tax=Kineococcus radiotolerans TaxID=131568 RepID=UPI00193D5CED|nr:glycosyltransferase family 4 protein [Kineococcus radiotolerans]
MPQGQTESARRSGNGKRLLIVSAYFPPAVGGVESYVLGLAKAMSARGCRVTVLTTGSLGLKRPAQDAVEGVSVLRLPVLFKVSYTPLHPLWPFWVRQFLAREKFDVINVHTPVPGLADLVAAQSPVPLVVTYHAASLLKDDARLLNVLISIYGLVERGLLRRADQVLAVSPFVADRLQERSGRTVDVLPNALNGRLVAPVAHRLREQRFTAAFLARLDATHGWKGLSLVLQALDSYRQLYGVLDVDLVVIGDGDSRTRYEREAEALGLERFVTFVGHAEGARKFDLLREAEVMITYPTTANDAFPTVFLEAWASGMAVVSADIGAIPSVVADGETALLARPNSPIELAQTLRRMAEDRGLRERLADHGRARLVDNFTWEAVAASFDHQLDELIEARS